MEILVFKLVWMNWQLLTFLMDNLVIFPVPKKIFILMIWQKCRLNGKFIIIVVTLSSFLFFVLSEGLKLEVNFNVQLS
jgi:putative effector of murein hydrolase LrgA (UPF0299 family)